MVYIDNDVTKIVIGTVNFHGDSVRTGEPLGECRIEVHSGEFDLPLFYVVNDNGFKAALCIDKPRFYRAPDITDILNEEQIIDLQKFMKSKSTLKTMKKFDTWKSVKVAYELMNGSLNMEKKADTTNYLKIYNIKKEKKGEKK